MLPLLDILNICLISAWPTTTSSYLGVIIVAIFAFKSSTISYIILYCFISNLFLSATSLAFASGFTLNAIITAWLACASIASVSLILPTPVDITTTLTSSLWIFSTVCLIASALPFTSAFIITLYSFNSEPAVCCKNDSRDTFVVCLVFSIWIVRIRSSIIFLAIFSSTTYNVSPTSGTSVKPKIDTAVLGVASVKFLPV